MPLIPSAEAVSVDYSEHDRFVFTDGLHAVICPSDLAPFTKFVEDTVILNPGRLTNGKGGGSVALLQLNKEKHAVKLFKI